MLKSYMYGRAIAVAITLLFLGWMKLEEFYREHRPETLELHQWTPPVGLSRASLLYLDPGKSAHILGGVCSTGEGCCLNSRDAQQMGITGGMLVTFTCLPKNYYAKSIIEASK